MKFYRLLLAITVLVFTQFGNAWGQTTYYWVGATGGNWSAAANWNTAVNNTGSARSSAANTDILVIDGDGTTLGGSTTVNVDASSITIGQFKVTNSTSVTLQSSSTTVSAITVSGATGDDFVIESGSSLNLDHATNPVSFAFTGTGNTGQVSGTINLSGSNSNIINTTGGTTTVFTISSGGIVNIGTTDISLVGSTPTLVFAAGSTCNLTATLTTEAYPIPLATWNTTSNLNLASASTSTTTAVNNVQSFGNFTVNLPSLTGTLSFWDGMASQQTAAIIKGNLTITAAGAANGTGVFRALTTGSFSINGNVVINQGKFHSASAGGVLDVYGNTTINTNGIVDVNGGSYTQRGVTLTNNGILTGPGSSSRLNFVRTTGAQTFAGSGSILTNIGVLGIENSIGVTITHDNQIITARVNLFRGTVTNSNKITIGTGGAGWVYIQIGAPNFTSVVGGSFDVAPTFNIGSGTLGLLYSNESTTRTTGLEVPSNRTVNYVLIENVNGVIISGGNLLTSTLNFAANCGNITTTASNVLRVTSTATNAITRNSTTAFVNGPLEMTIPSNLNSSATYLFPIGKSAINAFELVNPTTTSGGSVVVRAEVFDANTGGTSGTQMNTIATNRYWATSIVSGASNFTNTSVRLNSATTGFNAIAASTTLNGAYNLLGGADAVITASSLQTSAPAVTALDRFYVYGTLAPPTITAQPTLASATVCAGSSSGSMSITATGAASFQWQISSNSGSTWSDISGATSATYTGMTMSTAGSYLFRCNATNAAGTTTSNATGTLTVQSTSLSGNTISLTTNVVYCLNAQATTITVNAPNATVFQWFSLDNTNWGGQEAIAGATTNSYTPPTNVIGTKYYRCYIASCSGSNTSSPVSGAVTVTDGAVWTGAVSTDPTNAGNWNSTCGSGNKIINAGATNFPVYTDLTIAAGETYIINDGARVTVNGILSNSGTLNVNSGATIVQGTTSTYVGSGAVNVRQRITGGSSGGASNGRFWYLGTPVTGANATAFYSTSASNIVRERNEPANAWNTVANNAGVALTPGKGYYVRANNGSSSSSIFTELTLNFSGGGLNNGDVITPNLTSTGSSFTGYNLVSNPYPSYIDWTTVTKTNVAGTMWYRTHDGTNMAFGTVNAAGVGTTVGVSNTGILTKYVPPMQSFWVRVTNYGQNASLTFKNSDRSHFTAVGSSVAGLKSTGSGQNLMLRMNLLQGEKSDQIILYTDNQASNTLDFFDAEKMMQADYPQFYTKVGEQKTVINALNASKKQQSWPITMELPTTGVHSFVIEELEIDNGLVWLEDKQEEIMQALEPGTVYEFYANSGINAERFVLHFQLIDDATPINVYNEVNGSANFSGKGASVHAESAGVVVIKLPATTEGITNIQIRDAAGKLVYSGSTNTLETSVQLAQANGIYYVTLNSASGVEVRKVFIQQ